MWNFNQNQAANVQNSNAGWNVNTASAAGGENREFCEKFRTYVFTSHALPLLSGYPNTGSSNFGWNLGAPASVPMPMPAMPQPPSSYHGSSDWQDTAPGVEEVFSSKNAGAQSFAHYIVKWVS